MKIENVEIPRRIKIKNYLLSKKDEIFTVNQLRNKFNTTSQNIYGNLRGLAEDPKIDIEMFSLSNNTYFGTSQAIRKLEERVDEQMDNIKSR